MRFLSGRNLRSFSSEARGSFHEKLKKLEKHLKLGKLLIRNFELVQFLIGSFESFSSESRKASQKKILLKFFINGSISISSKASSRSLSSSSTKSLRIFSESEAREASHKFDQLNYENFPMKSLDASKAREAF